MRPLTTVAASSPSLIPLSSLSVSCCLAIIHCLLNSLACRLHHTKHTLQNNIKVLMLCSSVFGKASLQTMHRDIIYVRMLVIFVAPTGVCRSPMFNAEASNPSQCHRCFCFGITTECVSSNLYVSEVCQPLTQFQLTVDLKFSKLRTALCKTCLNDLISVSIYRSQLEER